MEKVLQPSFTSGELSPALEGRIDLEKYRTGVSVAENFVVRKFGGLSYRTGFKLIGPIANTWVTASGPTYLSVSSTVIPNALLVPFQFSTNDTYMLVFYDYKFHVIKNGAFVTSGGSILSVTDATYFINTSPFWSFALPARGVRYCQDGDTLYLTYPLTAGYTSTLKVRTITRVSDTSWTVSEFTHTKPEKPRNISAALYKHVALGGAPSAVGAGGIYNTATALYGVTAVDTYGNESEMLESGAVTYDASWPAGCHVRVGWEQPVSGTPVRYNVYKNSRGYWGYIGYIDAADLVYPVALGTTPAFIDDRIEENVAEGPPTWPSATSNAGPYGGYRPTAIAIHEQRMFTANTAIKPNTIFGSQTGSFENHSVHYPLQPTDALEVTLASGQINPIQHMVPLDEIVVLTTGDEWVLGRGRNTDGLTPTSVQFRRVGSNGSSEIRPVVIGNAVVFVKADDKSIVEMAYSVDADGLATRDLTLLAPHLFEGRRIISMAYQDSPDRTLWVVLDDGTLEQSQDDWDTWVPNRANLVSLTYEPSQDIWAWSRHQLAHQTYTATANGINFYRLVPINVATVQEANKSGLYMTARLDVIHTTASVETKRSTLLVLRMADRGITEWAENLSTQIPAIDTHLDASLSVDDDAYTPARAGNVPVDPLFLWYNLRAQVFGGYNPLVLVAGGQKVTTSWTLDSSGYVTWSGSAFDQAIIGLPYTGKIVTLPLVGADERGAPAIGDRQRVVKAVLRVMNTKGATAGATEDKQMPVAWAGPEEATGPVTGDYPVAFEEERVRQPRVVIMQEEPYPCNILSMVAEVEVGR